MEGRRWFFGANIVAIVFDVLDTLLKGAGYSAFPAAMWSAPVYLFASLAGLFSSHRVVQLLAAAVSFTLQMVYMFQELGVLGGR